MKEELEQTRGAFNLKEAKMKEIFLQKEEKLKTWNIK